MSPRIAVLLPCHNEAAAIASVVESFRAALPEAQVYVYDNASTDDTAQRADKAGAIVRFEARKGKGRVVCRMLADIEADIYVICDGDGTYEPKDARKLVMSIVQENVDMVVTKRVAENPREAWRAGHQIGNRLMTGFVAHLFGHRFTDIFSGYRALSRRFVKSFPNLASGFEIETELTIHALELDLPVAEFPSAYKERLAGSESKLRTYRDGWRISVAILRLYKDLKPIRFYGLIATALTLLSLALAEPVIVTYLETGVVPRLPTALLSTGIMLSALLSLASGFILDSVANGRREAKRLAYLATANGFNA